MMALVVSALKQSKVNRTTQYHFVLISQENTLRNAHRIEDSIRRLRTTLVMKNDS